jgi:amidase
MVEGLNDRRWSSVELVRDLRQRIERINGDINAIIVKRLDEAEQEAAAADERRARGDTVPLLGLPITIKESIEVAGLPASSGMPEYADRIPQRDAPLVRSLKDAGVIILGKTNLPYACDDWQANSPVYGRTDNPWDRTRSPGGSTGGGSAALAVGMTPLEMGSDIGGSVRFPAAFCGVYGHRQSETLVPQSGHFPGTDLPNRSMILNIMGPLARSAGDLALALDVISGAEPGEDAAWEVRLPEARHTRLADFRVAVFPYLDWLPVSRAVREGMNRVVAATKAAGATVVDASPDGFGDLRDFHMLYQRLLRSVTSVELNDEGRRALLEVAANRGDDFDCSVADALNGRPADYIRWHGERERYRESYRQFFQKYDILLAPITLTPPFEHKESQRAGLDDYFRTLDVDGVEVPYDYQVAYPGLATMCGQPATAFPAGLSEDGLPVGVQAIGPYLEDRTPIRFAGLIANEIGGFVPPPDYAT